jgi:hypothetical protein
MSEFWCPISEVFVKLRGEGDVVDGGVEYSKTGKCRGCTKYPGSDLVLYLSILSEDRQVKACNQTLEE